MSTYICRLMDAEGAVQGVIPIVGSSEADAILIARHHLKAQIGLSNFELWKGQTRILARGLALAEDGVDSPTPQINPITPPAF